MSAVLPIPAFEPVPLPLPVGLVQTLLVVTFALHIIAVDVAVGGTIIALIEHLRGRRPGGEGHADLARRIARMMPTAIAILINLGIPPLLFLQVAYGPAFYTSSVLIAAPWAAVVPLLIAAYGLNYWMRALLERGSSRAFWVGLGSAAAMLSVGFVLTSNATLMLRPDTWSQLSQNSAHGFNLGVGDATVAPRFLHMMLGMFAGAGVFVAVLSTFPRLGFGALARRVGLRWFIGATTVQLVVGPLLLFTQPGSVRAQFLGGSPVMTVVLWGAVAFGISALALAWRGQDPSKGASAVYVPAALVSVTVFGMVVVRHGVREHTLAGYGFAAAKQAVQPDWMTFGVFLAVAGVGVFVLWRMATWLKADLAARDNNNDTSNEA